MQVTEKWMGPVMVAVALAISDEGIIGVEENDMGFKACYNIKMENCLILFMI
jgi:hypothetical protein